MGRMKRGRVEIREVPPEYQAVIDKRGKDSHPYDGKVGGGGGG